MTPVDPACWLEGPAAPKAFSEQPLAIASGDCLADLRASLPALGNHLQEAAGLHADRLGCGLPLLQTLGQTWMLSRLALRLYEAPAWQEPLLLATWPSGIRGRLAAERQFAIRRPGGEVLLEASSEWLCVDLAAQRLARLPDAVATIAAPGTFTFGLCREKFPALPEDAPLVGETLFPVRRAEIDANHHVNNVHYAEWMRETLPEAVFFGPAPAAFDIEYKLAAKLGDTVRSRTYALSGDAYYHTIDRPADGRLLARAVTRQR